VWFGLGVNKPNTILQVTLDKCGDVKGCLEMKQDLDWKELLL